ncbi:MAG TPA: S-adenosylmethionine:tRNA ribosyltransferase-isomerase [Flavipsychrobacter sp.]|nr:S-adenosylmethionine:tRNA ribosyltransferase-isomerase [Flavipsychrobacter sp.]
MHPRELKIEDYTYDLPPDRIAQKPLTTRDASKLLVFRNEKIEQSVYGNIAAYLPAGSLMVFNQTKVIHARLLFQKQTGGGIEVFCLEPGDVYPDITTSMSQKRTVDWKCMVGGASKWKDGIVLQKQLENFTLSATIRERQKDGFTIRFSWNDASLSFAEVLQLAGAIPLPPYMNRSAMEDDKDRYQTIFAKEEGSVAAPTAGLHFTEAILHDLRTKQITTTYVTLHVGAGTFQPVKSATVADHEMHAEWMDVDLETIEQLIKQLGKPIIAVGTTSLRTIESLYWLGVKLLNGMLPDFKHIALTQWEVYELEEKTVDPVHALQALKDWLLQQHQSKLITKTQILIAPGYRFKIIDALITNFHQPRSTLLLLVSALIGDEWKKVYDYAMRHDFRFLSYGDGSLLWVK